jgi:hypothetical protein
MVKQNGFIIFKHQAIIKLLLPMEEDMIKTGEGWQLLLLDKTKKKCTRQNYVNYLDANLCVTSENTSLDPKGKKPLGNHQPETSKETMKMKTGLQKWKPPD